MLRKRIKVSVAVQKFVSVNDAARRDERVDGLSDRKSELTQHPVVTRRFNRNLGTGRLHDGHQAN